MAGHRKRPVGPTVGKRPPAFGSYGSAGVGKAASEFSRTEALGRAIRTHVVPSVESAKPMQIIPGVDAGSLYDALVVGDDVALKQVVPALLKFDVPFSKFYDQILEPVFARMQRAWAWDELDFVTIDLATTRLQMICNHYARERLKRRGGSDADARTVLLAQSYEETHTMGLSVVRALFMDAGWVVEGGPHVSPKAGLYETIGTSHYDVLALSSGHADGPSVKRVVARARKSSLNSEIAVCLGGPSVAQDPEKFAGAGADVVVDAATSAVAETDRLMNLAIRQPH